MAKKVKWGIGEVDEPEGMGSFDTYDGPVPPKGTYNAKLTLLRLKKNRNGDDMLNGLVVLDTTGEDREKRKVNGAPIWFNQNITEQGLPWVKQFLDALGVSWKDFQNRTLADDEEPPNITRLGSLKMTGDVEIRVLTKIGEYQGDTKAEVARFLKPRDAELEGDDEDDEEDEDDDLIEDGEEDEVDEDEEDAPLTEAELKAMSLADVKAEADALEITGVKGKANLIAAILEAQESDEDEDEGEGDDELREELEALDLAALKKRARANGSALKDVKTLDEEALVDLIISQEAPADEEDDEDDEDEEETEDEESDDDTEDEEDEDEEDEPEPPAKPVAKKSAKGKRPPF